MESNNNLDYMKEFIQYVDLRAKAQAKDIDVLAEVKEMPHTSYGTVTGYAKWGYAVVKQIGDMNLAIMENGKMYFPSSYYADGRQVTFYRHSLDEVEKIVGDYNEDIANMPLFYGFVRQYEGEPQEILDYQVIALKYFAEKNGIQYQTIFGCKGGYAEALEEAACIPDKYERADINNMQYICEKFFTDIERNGGILCVTDESRLDAGLWSWIDKTTGIIQVGRVQYDHDNIMEYHECIQGNTPEQEQCIPEYGCNSVPGDIPDYIPEQEDSQPF